MTKKLLTKSAEILEQGGFSQVSSAVDKTRQRNNITHTMFEFQGKLFYVRAKKYLYKGRAPFGVGHINHAISDGAMLVIYVDEEQSFYVFDPDYVQQNGEVTNGQSKMSDDREWKEVSIEAGVDIRDYVKRGNDPSRLQTGNETLASYS
jgi:hypothetical protein